MSWIDKILPPRIKREEGAARKTVPEGLWTKCPGCEAVLYTAELQKTFQVAKIVGSAKNGKLELKTDCDDIEIKFISLNAPFKTKALVSAP